MDKLLTKDEILAVQDLKRQVVAVPEWGGSVTVSEMTGEMRDEWEMGLWVVTTPAEGEKPAVREINQRNVRARLLSFCIVDAEGNRMFTEAETIKLGRKSATALDRCAEVARRINGLSRADVEEQKKN
jgi:hypothetical protein